uniref:beta-1,6-N-acetylglucosaminyltransferase n=1 Tax=uncultured Alistipes sp. TaxID=538949 RepID=UPI002583071B
MSEFHIAFCIICHKYTPVLQELIDRLSVPGNGIFIHVDRKARMKDFAALNGKVRFVTPRIDIRWGDYGQICCMRRLYEATRSGDYRYIVLLSGDTLPLYDMTYIREFLAASYARNTEFVAMQPDLNLEEFYGKVRTAHYVPVLRWGGKRSLREKLRIKYAKHFRPARNPLFGKVPPLEKGCNWITITDRLRDYALEYARTHPDYNRFFRYTSCGDEIYFHTILGSSPLAGNSLVPDENCSCPSRK